MSADNQPNQSDKRKVTPSSSMIADRWLLVVRGLVQVSVEDQEGRRIGPSKDPSEKGFFVKQIPRAYFTPGTYVTSIFLGAPGIYTFDFSASFPNEMNIFLSAFSPARKMHTFFFRSVKVTEADQVKMKFQAGDSSTSTPSLSVIKSGQSEDLAPMILSSEDSDDTVPPVTQIEIGEEGNIATVKAEDNQGGSGVFQTYFTTDGTTRTIYDGPFKIPASAKIVMAYSEDRAGNLEYPGAVRPVLGISEDKLLVIPKDNEEERAYDIQVTNLDPIGVTGSIAFVASANAPWVSIDKPEGKTPASIKIIVRLRDVSRGSHEAHVVIRALTPETIFGKKTLIIRVESQNSRR